MPSLRTAVRRASADIAERPDRAQLGMRRDTSVEQCSAAAGRSLLDIARASETAASSASAHRGTAGRLDIVVPLDTVARLGTAASPGRLRFRTVLGDILEEQCPVDKASTDTVRRPVALGDIAASRRASVPASVVRELAARALADTAPDIVDPAPADPVREEHLLAEAQEGARPAIYPAGLARGADLVPPCDTLPSARRGATPPRLPHLHQSQVVHMQSPKFLAAFSLCCS